MEDTLPTGFPLHASIKSLAPAEGEETSDYVLCLWKSQHSLEEFCGQRCADFAALLDHLKEEHQLKLIPSVDYSADSRIIFRNRLDALEFYLSKAMSYEDLHVTLESPIDLELSEWLSPIFEKLAELRKPVMDRLLFDADFEKVADAILDDIDQI